MRVVTPRSFSSTWGENMNVQIKTPSRNHSVDKVSVYILVRPLIMYKNELEYLKYKLFFAETNQTVVS